MEIVLSNKTSYYMPFTKAIKYFSLSKFMANTFSKDTSTKVGALFLSPNTLQILSLGYNGMPRGIDENISERWERPNKYLWVEHAERNAIYNSSLNGVSLLDSICVVSMFPCVDCARAIIQSGCKMCITLDINEYEKETYERWKDIWKISIEMFNETGIKLLLIKNTDLV